jgi:glycosyltransferase involved in cell wall biosynthesis
MLTPWRVRCGISDYSRHLVGGLRALPEIADVRIVEPPPEAAHTGTGAALRRYFADENRFRALGTQMNAGDLAHIQHQYFFFGGVAPHKNHARSLLNSIHIPLVMTVHEIAQAPERASPLLRAALRHTNSANFLNPRISKFIVHTGADRAALHELGVEVSRVHVVTHGIPAVAPLPDRAEVRHALGLEGRRVLTLFGFLSVKKGHDVALAALRHLPDDVLLLLAGDRHPDDRTEYVPALRAKIAAMGLSSRVRITGYLPEGEIPALMAATDLALAPYLQSSGSGSLANLLAYGRAVVASDIPPHREIAREKPACLALFSSGDPEALAALALDLLADDARRIDLQAAALTYAARHSYAVMAQETVAIYRLALSSS